jgi:ribosomal protein L3
MEFYVVKEIRGEKLHMSQDFAEDGRVTPVTLIKFEELPEDLTPGTPVKVTGVSKGKGFAGTIKRWGFSKQSATHGQSDRERAPGSIGGTTTPGRVYKGKKMAGRLGGKRATVRGLTVAGVDPQKKIIKISGPIPGPRKGKVTLQYEPGEGKKTTENREQVVEKNEK